MNQYQAWESTVRLYTLHKAEQRNQNTLQGINIPKMITRENLELAFDFSLAAAPSAHSTKDKKSAVNKRNLFKRIPSSFDYGCVSLITFAII